MKTDEEKTHFKKAFDSPYLSSDDIVEPTILTVQRVELLRDLTKRTKTRHNTAFFVEKEIRRGEELKPMILNVGNSRTMKKLSGSAFIDDWTGIHVTIYVDNKVKMMGEITSGLRISPDHPRLQNPALKPDTQEWTNAVAAYKRDGNLDLVKKHREISPENEEKLIEEAKNVD